MGFFTTEDTEVTEALGSLVSNTAGPGNRFNHSSWVHEIQGSPRRDCRSRMELIETAFTAKLCSFASARPR
jgi:hypothetical protein